MEKGLQEHWQRQFSGKIRRTIYSMVAICADMDNTNHKIGRWLGERD